MNTFDFNSTREFPEPTKKLFNMEKISNEDLNLSDMPGDSKASNPHEPCPYVREENIKSPIGLKESEEVKSRSGSPDKSPARPRQTPPPHVILNEIDQSRWIDLGGGWRFQVKSNLKQIRNTKMIFAMFDHKSFENKNVSEEIPHARWGTFHVSYYLRNLNSDNEETDIHATYAFKNAKTKNNEKRHYGPRFSEKTQKKTFKHTGKPYCLRELLQLFDESRPDENDIFIDYINDLKLKSGINESAPVTHDFWPMRRKGNKSGRRSSRR